MQPGRDLDIEIGKRIIKLMILMNEGKDGEINVISPRLKKPGTLPYYSTNVEDTHMLIDFLKYKDFYCNLGSTVKDDGSLVWRCSFFKENENHKLVEESGKTMSHAVCLAALRLENRL